ncbi:DEAD-box ATP-dependent RNA helicase 39 [Apostasia shenzhenica]|uniref:DEAD-box ATP-dependent RNA helicase 39 n=1 Tax=Apostasia shenzhenica TaxID=1088818 RepID=A0A2I0B322_9ASPA|nr:DEAD-box ATP-dependent RNA helicase 39 [Apostasia shenzhenica]
MTGGVATGRAVASLSVFSSSILLSQSFFSLSRSTLPVLKVFLCCNRAQCFSTASVSAGTVETVQPLRHSLLLERLRARHLKDASKGSSQRQKEPVTSQTVATERKKKEGKDVRIASSFEELGLCEEVMSSLREMGISVPTEIQSIGVPAVLKGQNVVLGSHTGSGKTLAYMLPLVQLLRRDEELSGMLMKPRRPKAVVLCPTRELTEQVFRVAKSISHHARFRSTVISGGGRLKPQEDSLNFPIDMVVGTPGRILQHIEDGNLVYGEIKYLVLDEADTMFDRGFGPDIRKFLGPLKKRAAKTNDVGFQTILVAATMTKAVQKLIDEEFEGIIHFRTSTLHKKVASAWHDFVKVSGSENKLECLLQVLEPSLAKGNRIMVFCNTLNSSRAVDHFLAENQIYTVNYHGEVPAEERVENLKKFKSDEGDCPTLVCTDLAARGLDLDVDHVIMFDFPLNPIDYLHRTGRTARMGAKGKVTSLVTKRDVLLAERIEDAMRKNESLESLNVGRVRRDAVTSRVNDQKQRSSNKSLKGKSTVIGRKATVSSSPKLAARKFAKKSASNLQAKTTAMQSTSIGRKATVSSSPKLAARKFAKKSASNPQAKTTSMQSTSARLSSLKGSRFAANKNSSSVRSSSRLSVVGFRGRSSRKKEGLRSS